jgi:hypothetical protein
MGAKPLQAEVEYEATLAEIESLWRAPFGSPEGDRLDEHLGKRQFHSQRWPVSTVGCTVSKNPTTQRDP